MLPIRDYESPPTERIFKGEKKKKVRRKETAAFQFLGLLPTLCLRNEGHGPMRLAGPLTSLDSLIR